MVSHYEITQYISPTHLTVYWYLKALAFHFKFESKNCLDIFYGGIHFKTDLSIYVETSLKIILEVRVDLLIYILLFKILFSLHQA